MDNEERDALVQPLYLDYWYRLTDLRIAGKYPYNSSFKGHLSGADPATTDTLNKDEDIAIYLLQQRHHREVENAQLASFIDAGAVKITREDFTPGEERRGTVVVVGEYMGGTGYREYRNVRVRAIRGSLVALPPRARTRGYSLSRGTAVYFLHS